MLLRNWNKFSKLTNYFWTSWNIFLILHRTRWKWHWSRGKLKKNRIYWWFCCWTRFSTYTNVVDTRDAMKWIVPSKSKIIILFLFWFKWIGIGLHVFETGSFQLFKYFIKYDRVAYILFTLNVLGGLIRRN